MAPKENSEQDTNPESSGRNISTGLLIATGLPFVFQWFANGKIFFTTVKEGTAMAVMRGESFQRFIMSFKGYHLNDPTQKWFRNDKAPWEVIYHGKTNRNGYGNENTDKEGKPLGTFAGLHDKEFDSRPRWMRELGLYWVGIPPFSNIKVYEFEWNEMTTDEKGVEAIAVRAESTDYINIKDFVYAIPIKEAESNDLLALDGLSYITVAIRNPFRAMFSGEDWLLRTTSVVNHVTRKFFGDTDYKSLIAATKEKNKDGEKKEMAISLSKKVLSLNKFLPNDKRGKHGHPPYGLTGRYGVVIRASDLQSINFSGDGAAANQKAATAVYVAEQTAKAEIIDGRAKSDVIVMKGKANADALNARLATIAQYPDTGLSLAQLDAVTDSGKNPAATVVWAGNPVEGLAAAIENLKKGGTK